MAPTKPSDGPPTMLGRSRFLAWGGIIGPLSFVSAWVWGSVTSQGYSPITDPISRLAALNATTRPVMTAGLVIFGVGLLLHSMALRKCRQGPAWIAQAVSAVASFAVAATPLDGPWGDRPHAISAAAAYGALVAVQVLSVRQYALPLSTQVDRIWGRRLAAVTVVSASVTATCLVLSVAGPSSVTGLFQRIGLTTGHLWIIGNSCRLLGLTADPSNPANPTAIAATTTPAAT